MALSQCQTHIYIRVPDGNCSHTDATLVEEESSSHFEVAVFETKSLNMLQIRELVALTGTLLYLVSSNHAAATLHDARVTEEYGLNDAAKARGKLYFGTATEPSKYLQDAAYYRQLNNTHDFGQLVAEGSMKWDKLEPERNVFDFSVGDQITGLAAANGQITRCHNLLWHLSTPDWVANGGFDNATLISIIENHITEVVKHYKGSCYAWDVVNEG